ncbi:MAG: hypothetical protein PHY59_06605 [Methanobacterium sp.]|nr:hypothetical protein [Methanobacterium sp.]
MNMRLVFSIFLIVLFAIGFGFISYSQSTGKPLNEVYSTGNIVITQNTSAGTVPHIINIVNNGQDHVKVEVGDVLISQSSQDLVIAENKTINKNTTNTVFAYCLDPSKRAIPSVILKFNGTSTNAIKQTIMCSNINDINSSTNAQAQIWILKAGVDFNIYTGEPVAMVELQKINYTTLRQIVSDAKTAIATRFNINVNSIDELNQNNTSNTGIDGLIIG